MIAITQPKIAGLDPRWARFPGFSLLFDPPPSPGPAFAPGDGIEMLTAEGIYGGVERVLRALDPDRLLRECGFCALPPASYHVTAYDVANVADLTRCRAEVRDELAAAFARLPGAGAFDAPSLRPAAGSALASAGRNLEFGVGGLVQWGGVLVLRLEPSDPAAFARFVAARAALAREYAAAYGVGGGETYTPHLSLGYALDETAAALVRTRITEWDRVVGGEIGAGAWVFPAVSLYGFTDMATFFRRTETR